MSIVRDISAGVGMTALLASLLILWPVATGVSVLVLVAVVIALPGAFWLGRVSASRRQLAVEDDSIIDGEWREL